VGPIGSVRAMAGHHFRAGIIAVVRRTDGQVLAFERADQPGQWQLPQGGLERGEAPLEAAWRELGEETGLGPDDVELAGEPSEWLVAEWPLDVVGQGARLGQIHRWFEFRARDDGLEPHPDGREFRAWRWVTAEWLVANVVAFKQPAYRRVLGEPSASSSERTTRFGDGG
jgi:putative (di)nucleoside polyphosphate hydrolase